MSSNLVNITTELTARSDGSLSTEMTMGWFYVEDHISNHHEQHLLVHSKLPEDYASRSSISSNVDR